MISNERRWPSQHQAQREPYHQQPITPRPASLEVTLAKRELQIERKYYLVMLKQNARGRFLRISEQTTTRSSSIIIPESGFKEFKKLVDELGKAAEKLPAMNYPEDTMPNGNAS